MTWQRPLLRPAVLAIFVFMGLGLRLSHADDRDAIERWELQCEEARAHIAQCCQVNAAFNCQYQAPDSGCDSSEVTPDLHEWQARCLRETDCTALVSAGFCNSINEQNGQLEFDFPICQVP